MKLAVFLLLANVSYTDAVRLAAKDDHDGILDCHSDPDWDGQCGGEPYNENNESSESEEEEPPAQDVEDEEVENEEVQDDESSESEEEEF